MMLSNGRCDIPYQAISAWYCDETKGALRIHWLEYHHVHNTTVPMIIHATYCKADRHDLLVRSFWHGKAPYQRISLFFISPKIFHISPFPLKNPNCPLLVSHISP